MSRWPADARTRLERAALDLFTDRGFAATTVPEITERAGLTTRTFFRHFADKREVLFAYDSEIPAFVGLLLSSAPASSTPMAVLEHALGGIADKFQGERDYLLTRRRIVVTDDSLRERELRKLAALVVAIRQGFLDRGTDDLTATLAAHVAVSIFSVGLDRWLDADDGSSLHDVLAEALATVAGLTG